MAKVMPEDWGERYQAYIAQPNIRQAIAAQDSRTFWTGYPRIENKDVPWAKLSRPLSECTVGLVSTGGMHLPSQPPFHWETIVGDPGVRPLPASIPLNDLPIAHGHYDETFVRTDINVIVPVDRLRELISDGFVAKLAPTVWSTDGYCTDAAAVVADAGAKILEGMKREAVDVALLVPV